MIKQLFISYSRKDHAFIDKLTNKLNNLGFCTWLDRSSILGGEQWRKQIVTAIEDSSVFILALSPNSIKSDDVRKELDIAENSKKRILPITIKSVSIPIDMKYQLAGLQRIEFGENFEYGFDELIRALSIEPKKSSSLRTSLVGKSLSDLSLNKFDFSSHLPKIKIVGIGGGGINAVSSMIRLEMGRVEFVSVDTNLIKLKDSLTMEKLLIGSTKTNSFGTSGDPSLGRQAAKTSADAIRQLLQGSDLIFLICGLGGGTGSGAISVFSEIAKEEGIVVVAIVSSPFSFEAESKKQIAKESLDDLIPRVNTLVSIPNDSLLYSKSNHLLLNIAFQNVNNVIQQAVQCVTDLTYQPGLINVDFSHLRKLLAFGGEAFLTIGYGEGENIAVKAIKNAINHPVFGNIPLKNACSLIVNFSSDSNNLTIQDVSDALEYLRSHNRNSEIIMGSMVDDNIVDKCKVSMIVSNIKR